MHLCVRYGLIAAIVGALAGSLVSARPAGSHFGSSEYSYPGSGCAGAVDPVSLLLYGVNAYQTRARQLVERETNWPGDGGADQYARSHSVCTQMDSESYSNCCFSRMHVRYNQTYHRDDLGRWETVGTPHDEGIVGCGHATRSYISARNAILNAMNPPFGYSYQYWGDTAVMIQCDGRGTSSDGYVVWINIG